MPIPESPNIYLDHAATTPVDPAVKAAMLPFLEEEYGNPSSLHRRGKKARDAVSAARQVIAEGIGAKPDEIVFTGSGTEADNLAVLGVARALKDRGRHIITTAIEHSAVLNPCRHLENNGWTVTYLPVDADGRVRMDDVAAALRPDTVLVSVMHGNNEIGSLQPVAEIGRLLSKRKIPFHTDAVQTLGKLPLDVNALSMDYLTMSAHKIYGPKGVGALYIRASAPQPVPLVFGGGQEHGLRSGTENVAGIVGFAQALRLALAAMPEETPRLKQLQEYFIDRVMAEIPAAVLNGPRNIDDRVPGNVHFSFSPPESNAIIEGETIVLHLDLKKIAVSSGSACHSEAIEPSRIVLATGKPEAIARSTVRFSFGKFTTEESLDRTVDVLSDVIKRLGSASDRQKAAL